MPTVIRSIAGEWHRRDLVPLVCLPAISTSIALVFELILGDLHERLGILVKGGFASGSIRCVTDRFCDDGASCEKASIGERFVEFSPPLFEDLLSRIYIETRNRTQAAKAEAAEIDLHTKKENLISRDRPLPNMQRPTFGCWSWATPVIRTV